MSRHSSPRTHGATTGIGTPRLRGIEGLRGLAASSILVYHAWLYGAPSGGEAFGGPAAQVTGNLRAGVTLFFVLSGFLLFRPWAAAALAGREAPSIRRYLRNRLLRIAPAYVVILLLVAVLLERTLIHHPWQLLANLVLAQNYVPDYVFGSGIVPAWSLCIEVSFYALLPVLGWLAVSRGHAWVPVAGMAALGLAAKALPVGGPVWGLTLLTHADWFAAGMAAANLHVLSEAGGRARLPGRWRPAAGIAVVVLCALAIVLYDRGVLSALENQTPVALACGLVLLIVVTADGGPLLRVLESRAAVALGLVSYSLFLWHDPLLRWLRREDATLGGAHGFLVNVLLLAAVTLVLSSVTYVAVERPALALKRGRRRRAPAAADVRGRIQERPEPAPTQ